jgi:hypothetical protein
VGGERRADFKIMAKKIIFLIIIVLIIAAGGFFWWQSQEEVRELNKNLPEGVRVVKSLFGPFEVINERYNYIVRLPKEQKKISTIEYLEKKDEEMRYICTVCKEASIILLGSIGKEKTNLILESYKPKDGNIDLEKFIQEGNPTWLRRVEVKKEKLNDVDVIKVSREFEWGRLYHYFFKGTSNFYRVEFISEEFIQKVILNGRW